MNPVSEHQLREQLVHYGRSLFMRGYSSGGSGNLSVKLADGGYLVPPETDGEIGRRLSAASPIRAPE